MKRDALKEVRAEDLKDHAQPARIERIWRRIEQDMTPRTRRRELSRWMWAPAAAACIFGGGVLVGARFFAADPPLAAGVAPEPAPAGEPASAPPTASRVVIEPQHRPSPRAHGVAQPAPAPIAEPPSSAEAEPLALEPAVPEPVVVSGPPEWQRFADDGNYREALAAIERNGGFETALRDATAEQLMLLVDVARATSQRDRAIMALRRVVSEHGSDPNAPVAAWMLGNELAKAGDQEGAAQAFAMYRALSPNGDFAEDALAREFEVAVQQGSVDHARKLAEQYAKDFPDGPRLEDIRAELEDLRKRRTTASEGNGGAAAQSGASSRESQPTLASPSSGGSK